MLNGLLASLSQVAKTHDTGGVEFWHQPDRAGWLYKQGDVISTWRRRWFVLKDGRLFWFMNENVTPESKTRGVIDLRNCLSVASAIEKTNKEGSFEITCDGETKFFIADDEDIKDQWLSAIASFNAKTNIKSNQRSTQPPSQTSTTTAGRHIAPRKRRPTAMTRETRTRNPVSYADSGSSTPAWMKSTKAFTKEPEARERKPRTVEKAKKAPASVTKRTPTKSVAAEDDTAVRGATAKRGRGRPPGTTKAAMAKRTGGGKPEAGAKAGVSRKVSAMAKAAAIAKEGLKRPAKYFESSDRSTSGRKVPKRASESSPGSDGDSPDVFLRRVKTPSEKTPPRGRGRPPASSKLGHAAAAAKEAANRANGILNANEGHIPQSTAWSGAYRMLQTSHEKLQAKYDKLKAQKLQDMLKEADRQQGILLEHERKADELVHHLRSEADRQRDIASRAEGANEKAYSLERENAELRETVLAYQGKMLRMEQELDAKRSNKIDEMQAGASGRDLTSYGLEALTGLRWEPLPRGMHRFTHVSTGFSFQLSAAEDEDHQPCGIDPFQRPKPGDKVAHEITFFPVNEGSIGGAVPPLLADPMDFDTTDMPVFTTKLLQALYNAKIALAQAQTQGASYSRA